MDCNPILEQLSLFPLILMRAGSLASLQCCLCIDTATWYKWALGHLVFVSLYYVDYRKEEEHSRNNVTN